MSLTSQSDYDARLDVSLSHSSGSTYTGAFTPAGENQFGTARIFAESEMALRISTKGGLNATYHRGTDLAFPVNPPHPVLSGHAASLTPYLIGHAASLTPY